MKSKKELTLKDYCSIRDALDVLYGYRDCIGIELNLDGKMEWVAIKIEDELRY